ncbi:MAG: cytochrome oxidase putative small subunit CydP [Gammaproteobacteria bacterium]
MTTRTKVSRGRVFRFCGGIHGAILCARGGGGWLRASRLLALERAYTSKNNPTMHRQSLATEISVALTAKLIALLVLYLLFFTPAERPHVDQKAIAEHFYAEDSVTGVTGAN